MLRSRSIICEHYQSIAPIRGEIQNDSYTRKLARRPHPIAPCRVRSVSVRGIENRARSPISIGPINKSRECNRRGSLFFCFHDQVCLAERGWLAEPLTLALAYSLQRRSLSCFAARVLTLFRFVLGTKQRAQQRAPPPFSTRCLALFSLASSGLLRFPYRAVIDSTFDVIPIPAEKNPLRKEVYERTRARNSGDRGKSSPCEETFECRISRVSFLPNFKCEAIRYSCLDLRLGGMKSICC